MIRWPVIIVKNHCENFATQQILNFDPFFNNNVYIFCEQIARNIIILKLYYVFDQNAYRSDLIIF